MKTLLLPLLAVTGLALPAAVLAEPKFGYVDLQRALNEVDEGKGAKASLKKEFDQKQKMLDEKQEELKRFKADFDKQSVVMADEAKKEKQNELDRKFIEVQGLYVQLQKELTEKEREMTRGIFDRMGAIIREIAEAEAFTMVFEKSDSGLLYAPVSLDLTNELIRKYNAKYKPGSKSDKKADGDKKAEADKKPKDEKKK
jgi:outer membrane protein